jgi:hypothetical protein
MFSFSEKEADRYKRQLKRQRDIYREKKQRDNERKKVSESEKYLFGYKRTKAYFIKYYSIAANKKG